MSDYMKKLEGIKAQYDQAKATLTAAKVALDTQAARDYLAAKQNVENLQGLMAEQRKVAEEGKTELEAAMKQSMGDVSDQVKGALLKRRNAEDMVEQYTALLVEAERAKTDLQLEASEAASRYMSAYRIAYDLWVKVNIYSLLAEFGERLRLVGAARPPYHVTDNFSIHENSAEASLFAELADLFKAGGDDDHSAYTAELGTFDLAGMARDEIASPAARYRQRSAEQLVAA